VKKTRAARERRRRLATTATVAGVVTGIVVLATRFPGNAHDSLLPDVATTSQALSTAAPPTLKSLIQDYVKDRDGAVSVAVWDGVANKMLIVHPSYRGRTASIVKADILETLLHRTHGHLSHGERALATSMIEHSSNDAATDLYADDGGPAGVKAFNDDVGLKHTTTESDWGLTKTSAPDQVELLRELLRHNGLLTDKARHFQRHLMRNVEADQRWGISGGVPRSAIVGNKNGWFPLHSDQNRWTVNSIGWVRGDGKRYDIAVLTKHNASEHYGINTVEHIAGLVWSHTTVDHDATS
jgi:hypothetical protein